MGEKADAVYVAEDGQEILPESPELAETDDNERWLTDGNCGKCRKLKYCGKPCKAQKERKAEILRMMIESRTGTGAIRKALGG